MLRWRSFQEHRATSEWRVTRFCGGQQCARESRGEFNSAAFCALGETFLVDDGCGDLRAADAKRRMLDAQETQAFDTWLGDAASCAGPEGARRALRRVVLVRAGPAPYLAVLDVNEKDGRPFTADVALADGRAQPDFARPRRAVRDPRREECLRRGGALAASSGAAACAWREPRPAAGQALAHRAGGRDADGVLSAAGG